MPKTEEKLNAREKLLSAAMKVIREKGYAATSVDDLCEASGVTKGAFFHHFKTKEHLAVAAAEHFAFFAGSLMAKAPYQELKDPVDRILGYIDWRESMLGMRIPEFTCLLGTMVQEAYGSNPAIRDSCEQHMFGHAEHLIPDIEAAKQLYAPDADFESAGLAAYTQAVLQGAFILAKAQNDAAPAKESLRHLRRYIELLFPKK